MRPVRRQASPQSEDFADYSDAKTELISRLGSGWINGSHLASYCSYCERVISTMLAVEHIEPKDGPNGKPELEGRWNNFLLACVNCNSAKGHQAVNLAQLFFPDRDNTFHAFKYLPDGTVVPATHLSSTDTMIADATLKLTGLDRAQRQTLDAHGRVIAEDRASQRMQVWGIAVLARDYINMDPNNSALKESTVLNAVLSGFFSIWMEVFSGNSYMRNRFVDAFSGTRPSGCFDPVAAQSISPAPNYDALPNGSKI